MSIDACGVKNQLYHIAEKHLDLKTTPSQQVGKCMKLEAEVSRTESDFSGNICSPIIYCSAASIDIPGHFWLRRLQVSQS